MNPLDLKSLDFHLVGPSGLWPNLDPVRGLFAWPVVTGVIAQQLALLSLVAMLLSLLAAIVALLRPVRVEQNDELEGASAEWLAEIHTGCPICTARLNGSGVRSASA